MAFDLIVWISSFLIVASLLGIVVYQLMCLSDLEFDYINPFDSSSRINRFVIPEFVIQGGLSAFFLFSGHWVMFLLNVPVLYYHWRLYIGKQYHVDVTEIFNLLNYEKRYRLMKLGFYLVLLFVVVYSTSTSPWRTMDAMYSTEWRRNIAQALRLVVAAVHLILENDSGSDPFLSADI